MHALFTKACVVEQIHLPALSVNVGLQVVHAPVKSVHAEQLDAQARHILFPGLYYPSGQVVGLTQTPPTKAIDELQPHMPGFGVFVVKDVLQPVQYPVLLQTVQFDGIATHLLVPSLY